VSISTEISETGIVIQSISPVDRIVTLKYFENGREVVKAVAVPAGIFQKTIPGKTPMFLDSDEMDVDIEKTAPSQAQIEAGNYKKKHIKFQGLDISVENEKGSVRSGVDPDGKKWATKMKADYGYIKGTTGLDDEHVDVFVGPNESAENAYAITIMSPPKFTEVDEQKVMLGYNSAAEAKQSLLDHYDSPKFFGSMHEISMDEFKEKVRATKGNPALLKTHILMATVCKKELRQGEHKTPPEGYPASRSEYADPDHYMFPLDTESRVRSAIGYFDKHDWASNEHKKRAAKRIVAAAKKFGIVVDKDDVVSRTARG
jgi:hypothetical protein